MKIKNRTKQMYADTLVELLKNTAFEKIQVKQICEACDTPRQTFYYHFVDKYALVAWIFDRDYEFVFSEPHCGFTIHKLEEMLDRIYSHRNFYKKVFTDQSQNSIRSYIHEFNVKHSTHVLLEQNGLVDDEQLYLIKHYSYGSIGMLIEWLTQSTPFTPGQFAKYQYESMPTFLRDAYINYHS